MKKLFSIFAVVMMAVISLNLNALTVTAAEPTTFVLKYDSDKEDWYYQTDSKWDDSDDGKQIYYLFLEDFKDGDYIVLPFNDTSAALDISNLNVGNLTIAPGAAAIVNVKSVKDCYVCKDASAIINGYVENAYVFENSFSNFNNDVGFLNYEYTDGELEFTAAVGGKLGHLLVHRDGHTRYDLYNFTDVMYIEDGVLKTSENAYSKEPAATAPSASATPAAPSTNADEYDEVPKTGDSVSFLWAFGFAAICFAGSYSLKKRA